MHNRKAGHHISTGVSDLRQLWLEIIPYDANDVEIFSSGKMDAVGDLSADTFLYHQVLGDANGNALERHDIWLAHQILSDTRIPADGTQRHSLALPEEAQHVRVRLLWRDAPASFVRSVLKQTVTDFPIYEVASWQVRSLP